jgi:peptide/nickel transport system permease protein
MRLFLYVLRRLVLLIPVLIGVSLAAFFLIRVLPGDPVLLIVPETATPADIEIARERYGLDRPLPEQYLSYLGGMLQGDFGTSITTNGPVGTQLAQRIPLTLELVSYALLIALVISIAGGVYAARRSGRLPDHVTRMLALAGNSLPEFWLGLVLILIFYQWLGLAPAPAGRIGSGFDVPTVTGFISIDALLSGNPAAVGSALHHLMLPVLTLAIVITAPLLRSVRASAIEVADSDSYRCAEAHGLKQRVLTRAYLLRPTLIRLPTLAAIVFGNLLGGSVLIEFVYSWQGLGQWALRGLLLRDYPVIQAFVLVAATAYVLVFLLADVLQAALDPRIKV